MREIIAAKIGTIITNDISSIINALSSGTEIRFLSRKEMQFMSACDLGHKWDNLSKAKTILIKNDDGTYAPYWQITNKQE